MGPFVEQFKGYKNLIVALVFLVWVSTTLASAPSDHWFICSLLLQPQVWVDYFFNLGEVNEGSSRSLPLCDSRNNSCRVGYHPQEEGEWLGVGIY